ncbi:MAG: DMT family transporter [Alphaproteobacteria bacterium]|nr:DMT family transporter [Alphaproteobacteria bacterium]MCB9930556.1 DMT family transporter [Alphaproteobacteria bacterium]
MFELWVPVTIGAAFLQNVRSAIQKHLKGRLSTTGATFVRFGFGMPVAIAYVLILHYVFHLPWPEPNATFAGYVVLGGLTQILATFLLVYLFGLRNFAVGTAYSKTEAIQAAVFGFVILGDPLSMGAGVAIIIGFAGVVMISVAHTALTAGSLVAATFSRTALIGLLSGALFGVSAVGYRGGSLAIGGGPDGFLMQAGFTLMWATIFQTIIMLAYMRWKEPGQTLAVARAWRPASLVGLAGVLGSVCWFTAMTIQSVAYVRSLGQIELIFTFASSYFIFKERPNKAETFGVILIAVGIVVLLQSK